MSEGKSQIHSKEFKEKAVHLYPEGGISYAARGRQLGLKSKIRLRQWAAKVKRSESLADSRGKSGNFRKGRPRT